MSPPAPRHDAARSWLAALPKVELHLHLEGAIPPAALWELIGKYGGDPSVSSCAALEERFTYRDFAHFIDTWVWKNGFLREYDDFTFVAEAVAADLARQNIRYVEAFYSPADFARHGLDTARLTEAIRRGLDRTGGVRVALIADLVRDFGPERGRRTLDVVSELDDLGVIGIGIGGSEQAFPPEAFAGVFRRARQAGLRTTAHAGEAAGPASVWGAIRALEVDRLGHATRAVEDPALVDELVRRRLPLELCPISNLRTGVVSSIGDHPTRLYVDRGIPVSINTDDPAMFGTSLVDELDALMRELAFTTDEILGLIDGAIDSSWLAPADRRALSQEFRATRAWSSPPD